jgi:hypothetical protein
VELLEKIGFRVMMVTLRPGAAPKYEIFAQACVYVQ